MDYDKIVELNNITISDCEEMHLYKRMFTVINDGKIVNFEKEV